MAIKGGLSIDEIEDGEVYKVRSFPNQLFDDLKDPRSWSHKSVSIRVLARVVIWILSPIFSLMDSFWKGTVEGIYVRAVRSNQEGLLVFKPINGLLIGKGLHLDMWAISKLSPLEQLALCAGEDR